MKIAMVGPANLGPYHYARFRALSLLIEGFTYIRVLVSEPYRPWSSELGEPPCGILDLKSNDNVFELMDNEMPDMVMTVGYRSLSVLKSAWWARRNGLPVVLLTDSTVDDRPRVKWKEWGKSFIVKRLYDAVFAAGERSSEYASSLGIAENMIWRGVDVVDNEHFAISSEKWQKPDGFPEKCFLAVTRLSHEKNLPRLLSAFKIYRKNGGTWGLIIAGTGLEEERLKDEVPDGLEKFVHWHGWAAYDELPSLYHAASCFVLPSVSEPWGLVVNEAMAARLPVLVSQRCGCVPELCHDGANGYAFDPFDLDGLAALMLRMSSGEVDLASMGNRSREIISAFTPESWARTVLRIAERLGKKAE